LKLSTKTNSTFRCVTCIGIICVALSTERAIADSLELAHQLLRVAAVQRHYEARTEQQTRSIMRSYSSIVSISAAVELPSTVLQQISNCYQEEYAWEKFEEGLALILAENLSLHELQLLIDFYGNLGLAPFEIQNFKDTIAKSSQIQNSSMEFMLTNSADCTGRDAALIRAYLATQPAPKSSALAID